MDKHISSQFDAELNSISTRVLEMGGMVERQIQWGVQAILEEDAELADKVLDVENEINRIELGVDADLSTTIARRQPTARDLRFLIGISKTLGNLERAGDEAARIARMATSIVHSGHGRRLPVSELRLSGELAAALMRRALDALARLDVEEALAIMREDDRIDVEFNGFLRKLVTFMMEDPRTISASLDLVFVAKAIERIGDHAKNIGEQIIYIVRGLDVRHAPVETVESALR
jgi:phosphate transport system protein